ncbi:FGGY-family carbohydrate kinase [Asticcacaulis sp. AND118]|uniref:FGGY-family carbohydrate kinase n=1 Tax=Asticcacaulis sp. AND118 TaxID=2840468 RepID=UPI001CFF76F2|nr:FGGY family carbohydrate kinase [Asticcacaulis sp. AND118]UDF03354.1 carbohydrate kinase [Asticcacaulis sp. AND118]
MTTVANDRSFSDGFAAPDASDFDLRSKAVGEGVCVVFDVGKTNAKLSVIDPQGHILSRTAIKTPHLHTRLYAAFDVDTLFAWFLSELKRVSARYRIDRIMPVAHGAGCAFLSADEQLLQPIQDYEASIPLPYERAYQAVRPAFEETLSPLLPNGLNLGAQIFWHARRDPKFFERVRYILSYAQYWTWRLSGVLCSEVTSLGCHTDLWNPTRGEFSSLAKAEGWAQRFAPLRPAWEKAGPLRPEIAEAIGLTYDCQVHVGLHDSNAALALVIARHQHDETAVLPVILTTGTWYVAMAPGIAPAAVSDSLRPDRDCLVNIDVYGRAVPCARFMGGRALELITNGQVDVPVTLDTIADVIQSGAMALPSFVDAGGPFPGRRGEIVGLETDTPETRAALGLIYVALIAVTSLDMIAPSNRPLLIEGPAAHNAAFCTLLASMRDGPVLVCETPSGVTRGAGAMAFFGDHVPPVPAYKPVEPQRVGEIRAYRAAWLKAMEND